MPIISAFNRVPRVLGMLIPMLALAFSMVAYTSADDVTYHGQVAPILRKHCVVCHNDQDLKDIDTSGGLSLSRPEALMMEARAGVTRSGLPERSSLFTRLITKNQDKRMPKDSEPLTEAEIGQIRQWISQGLKLGTPMADSPVRRKRSRQRVFADLTITTDLQVPPDQLGKGGAGKLVLTSRVAPLPAITALAFSPNGQWLACGSFRQVVLWDIKKGTQKTVLKEPLGSVLSLAFTPDNNTLIVAGGDEGVRGELLVYNLVTGKPRFRFTDASDAVNAVDLSPNGKILACTSFDRFLRLMDLATGNVLPPIKAHSDFAHCVAFSRDGNMLLTGGKDKIIKLWDVQTGKQTRQYTGHQQDVLAVLFAPDDKTFFSTGIEPALRRWDLGKPSTSNVVGSHSGGPVHQLARDPTGKKFLSVGADGTARLWNSDGKADKTLVHTGEMVLSAALSAGGTLAVTGTWEGKVRLWDTSKGILLLTLVCAESQNGNGTDWLALTPQGIFQASDLWLERGRFNIGARTAPLELVHRALHQPETIARVFAGTPCPMPLFTVTPAPKTSAKPMAKNTTPPKTTPPKTTPPKTTPPKTTPSKAASAKTIPGKVAPTKPVQKNTPFKSIVVPPTTTKK